MGKALFNRVLFLFHTFVANRNTMDQDKEPLLKKFKQSKLAEFIREKVKPVVGDVLEVVGDITGRDSVERLGQFLNDRKEDNEQVKALSYEFEKYKMEWQLEIESMKMEYGIAALKADNEEMANVRDREIQFMKQSGGKRDWMMGSVGIAGVTMMLCVIAALVFIDIPASNKDLAYMAFGSVLTIGGQIFNYYFGSSRGSAMKDNTIKNLKSSDKA